MRTKIKKYERGYTVIELLTVVGVIVAITGILTGIIFSTLRGTSKTNTTSAVAQNGNAALTIISNILTSSDAVLQMRDGPDIILNEDGDCTASPMGDEISLRRIDGGVTTLICDNYMLASRSGALDLPLIDTTQVTINTDDAVACYFICKQEVNDPYSPPSIEVGFTITDSFSGGSFEKTASAGFKTSVTLRNYSP